MTCTLEPDQPASRLSGASVLIVHGGGHIDLAIARSLGRAGAKVIAGSPMGAGFARYSRYVSAVLPFPSRDPQVIVAATLAYLRTGQVTHLISPEEELIARLNEHRAEIERFAVPLFPDTEAFHECLYKDRTLRRAARLGIASPRTYVPSTLDDLEACRHWTYPLVFKPNHRDPALRDPAARDYLAAYATSFEDLCQQVAALGPHAGPPMIQEFAAGEGIGVEVLMRGGEPRLIFQHRRLREKPHTGGISVLCESMPLSEGLVADSVRLLKDMNWDGVAMVEFRRDPATGIAKLLEVNGRFWGSLPLALHAGADFPADLLRSHLRPKDAQSEPQSEPQYRAGVRCRSLAHDTAALVDILRTGAQPRLAALYRYLAAFHPAVGAYIWAWDDPLPSLLHPWQRLRHLLRPCAAEASNSVREAKSC